MGATEHTLVPGETRDRVRADGEGVGRNILEERRRKDGRPRLRCDLHGDIFRVRIPARRRAADAVARRGQAGIENERVIERRRRSGAEQRVGRSRRRMRVRHRGNRAQLGARLFVEFARSGKREAVGRRLHLRLQAHAARAVEGQQSEANQNRQHHRDIGDHQSIRVAPQRKRAARETILDGHLIGHSLRIAGACRGPSGRTGVFRRPMARDDGSM